MFRNGLKSIWAIGSSLVNNQLRHVEKVHPVLAISKITVQPFSNYAQFSAPNLQCLNTNSERFLFPKTQIDFQSRNLTKFSLRSGKRKTVKAVLKRFYRLDWGMWIRTKCGRAKKLYRKSSARKRRLRQHVFTNAQQSYLLDKMVTNYWRKPKYYPDDPYNPYHKRESFPFTRKTPI